MQSLSPGRIIPQLPLFLFRHFAFLVGRFTADGAVSYLIFEHGVIGGASAPEFFSGKDLSYIDECERQTENDENDCQHIQKFHRLRLVIYQ